MVQMALNCDMSHTFHKQVTNDSPVCFCHPTVGNIDVSPKEVGFHVDSATFLGESMSLMFKIEFILVLISSN